MTADTLSGKVMPSLITAAIISISALFLQVSGHEIRIVKVEAVQDENLKMATRIDKKQDKMMYQLCVVINEGDLTKCQDLGD